MRHSEEQQYVEYVTHRLPTLRRTAYLLCGDGHRADDIVQIAVTKLYVNWRRARAADNLDHYVRAIVVRSFLNEYRRSWTKVRLVGPPEETPLPPAPPDPDVVTRQLLRSALTTVPPRQRAVLVLRFLCDLTVAETAEILGCSDGTVKSQTSHGLAALRRVLDVEPVTAQGRR